MKHTMILAAALSFLGRVGPASAAEMTFVRLSRPVTAAETAGGAPVGGMVHDFYATSDADLLILATHFNQSVYQHPYGSDHAAPSPEMIAYYPAVGADSFFTLPSSTVMLGGGFTGPGPEKAWGDLSNDGPQSDFLFGRLTTTTPGAFAGYFAVRGQETYIEMPFNFALPGASGPFTETLLVSGIEQSQTPYTPSTPSSPTDDERPASEPKHIKPALPSDTPAFKESLLAYKAALQESLAPPRLAGRAVAAIPEPATWVLGAFALLLLRRRRCH